MMTSFTIKHPTVTIAFITCYLFAKSINYALRDVRHGLLIYHVTLNCINRHLLIECYSVIVIECRPTSSCLILL